MTETTFEVAVKRLHDGRCTFDEFARATRGRWEALARHIMRRWRLPPWVAPEDMVQELLLGAWRVVWKYDPRRGVSLAKYVIYGSVDYAKKKAHKVRGANLHRGTDSSPSRFEVTLSRRDGEDYEWWANLLRSEPDQEDGLLRREDVARALAACESPREAYVVSALAATGSIGAAAERLYAISRGRSRSRVEAIRSVARTAVAVAGRLAEA